MTVNAYDTKIADMLTEGITQNWGAYNARPVALAAMVTLEKAGFVIVPKVPTQNMLDEVCTDEPLDQIYKDENIKSLYGTMIDAYQREPS